MACSSWMLKVPVVYQNMIWTIWYPDSSWTTSSFVPSFQVDDSPFDILRQALINTSAGRKMATWGHELNVLGTRGEWHWDNCSVVVSLTEDRPIIPWIILNQSRVKSMNTKWIFHASFQTKEMASLLVNCKSKTAQRSCFYLPCDALIQVNNIRHSVLKMAGCIITFGNVATIPATNSTNDPQNYE